MRLQDYLDSIKLYMGVGVQSPYAKYLDFLIILIAFFALSKVVVFISQKIILQLTKKTKTNVDDLIVKNTNKPISIILVLIGIRLALLPLGIRPLLLGIAEHIISSMIVFVIAYIVVIVSDILIDTWGKSIAEKTESKLDDQLLPVFRKFSRIFIFVIGFLVSLTFWGIAIGPFLTSLGIVGVAIAFALQSTLGNIFGGISIILDKSVKVGDVIKLDNDSVGTVLDVGLRSTKIRTFDNEVITIPSGKLADSKFVNFLQPDPPVRVAVEFGVEYGSEPSKVREAVLGTLKHLKNVLKEPAPKVLMIEMSDFALRFRALFWVESFELRFETKALATEDIYNSLRREKIGIPFPTRTVYLKKEG